MFTRPFNNEQRVLQRKLNKFARCELGELNLLFLKHKVKARVDRGKVVASATGNFIRYYLSATDKVSRVEGLEKDMSVLLSRLRGLPITATIRLPGMFLELPYPFDTRPLAWEDADLGALGQFEMLIGRDYTTAEPAPVTLDFRDRSIAHMLVSGSTGSGKTAALIGSILSLCWSTSPADAQIIILDPKFSSEMMMLAELPHVAIYNETQDCADAIASVKAEMNRRKRRNARQRLFLVVEELAELMIEVGNSKTSLFDQLKSIAGVGRGLGVHIIACTQKASVDVVDTVMRANLNIRLGLRVSTPEESRIATGIQDAGCETLPGYGAGQYVKDARPRRVQTHYVAEEQIVGIAYQIAGKWGSVDPYRIEMVMSDDDSEIETDGELDRHVQTVLTHMGIADIFDADGNVVRGVKIQIVRLIFGEDANPGGSNDRYAKRILEALKKFTFTT